MSPDSPVEQSSDFHITLVADIVAAYVSNNSVPASELGSLIASIHSALSHLGAAQTAPIAEERKEPAVSVKKSVTPDYLICLEDGKKFKSLKRHLSTAYGLSPDAYRTKWGLPNDYPMVAPAYSAQRSQLAKDIGLGQQTKTASAKVSEPAKTRGRPKKAA